MELGRRLELTWAPCSLAQAKTGTGKTLAFLIPSIELLLRSNPQPANGQISILILSVSSPFPTRYRDPC